LSAADQIRPNRPPTVEIEAPLGLSFGRSAIVTTRFRSFLGKSVLPATRRRASSVGRFKWSTGLPTSLGRRPPPTADVTLASSDSASGLRTEVRAKYSDDRQPCMHTSCSPPRASKCFVTAPASSRLRSVRPRVLFHPDPSFPANQGRPPEHHGTKAVVQAPNLLGRHGVPEICRILKRCDASVGSRTAGTEIVSDRLLHANRWDTDQYNADDSPIPTGIPSGIQPPNISEGSGQDVSSHLKRPYWCRLAAFPITALTPGARGRGEAPIAPGDSLGIPTDRRRLQRLSKDSWRLIGIMD